MFFGIIFLEILTNWDFQKKGVNCGPKFQTKLIKKVIIYIILNKRTTKNNFFFSLKKLF